jgi:NTE family protein
VDAIGAQWAIDMDKHTRRFIFLLLLFLAYGVNEPMRAEGRQASSKICLVLSGGGARGASHIGVLKVLESEHIPIDCIAATSFGALVGGLYSIGYSASEIENLLSSQDWNNIFSDAPQRRLTPLIERRDARYQGQISFNGWNPELPTGLWGGQRLVEALEILTAGQMLQAEYNFDNLPIQFRAVSTNLVNGKAYVFKQGPMAEALRASMAIPMIFTPLEKDGMLLVDGGLVDNLPTDIAKSMGADIIIAVNATTPLMAKDKIRTLFDVIDQSISLQMERNVQESLKTATLVLSPNLQGFSNADYPKIHEIVRKGEEEANNKLELIKALVAGIPLRPHLAKAETIVPIVDSVSVEGLKNVPFSQLRGNLKIRNGVSADPQAIVADVSRLYATRLFDSVGYNLEPLGNNHYRLVYVVKEAPLHTLGGSLRYDTDYNFVALAEFTARQMFNTPSIATVTSQLGGLEDHSATLRFIPSSTKFFLEPKVEVLRLERLDIREEELVDKFTDKREGGQFLVGGTIFRQLEIRGGYRYERVRIAGGAEPNRLTGSNALAGLAIRFNRDSLDSPEFPRSGMTLNVRIDKESKSVGSDFDYSRWQADYQRYLPVSPKSTIRISASAAYSHGSVPFYDHFYVGGYSFSEKASRQFFGLKHDEIAARQIGVIGLSYRRQLFSHPLNFIKRGFLMGIYNGLFYSQNQTSPYEVNYLNGAGVSVAFDTMLGPVRLAAGWSESGRFNLYFTLGPAF